MLNPLSLTYHPLHKGRKMKIRVLGAHNLETSETRHTCFLVDEVLAIDAGSLMTGLSDHEKNSLQAILLTHRHFDHVRDLPSLGLQTMDNGATIDLFGLPDTLDAVSSHLMDGLLYPNFTLRPTLDRPKYRLHAITPDHPFNVGDLEVLPLPVPHGAPAVGFVVRKGSGTAAFTGDTGGGLLPFLSHTPPPQLLFVEVTFPNNGIDRAHASPPLTPSILQDELEAARQRNLPIPHVVAVHRDSRHEQAIIQQLAQLSHTLNVPITPAHANHQFPL